MRHPAPELQEQFSDFKDIQWLPESLIMNIIEYVWNT